MSYWQWAQLIGFKIFWLLAVMGQNATAWILVLLLVGHFIFTPSRLLDVQVSLLLSLGLVVDVLLTLSGVFMFTAPPIWLLLLWGGFILTLGHSLQWLAHLSLGWLVIIGAVTGPASYFAGWQLGAVILPYGVTTSMTILVPVWAVLFPLLVRGEWRIRQGDYL